MTNLNFQFKKELSSVTEDYPRWYDCVMTSGYLSFAVGYMYVKRHFDDKSKTKVSNRFPLFEGEGQTVISLFVCYLQAIEMVEDIRSAFKDELAEVPWMDEETKKEAMEKADFMNHFIGYPNWYENITFLEEYYKGVRRYSPVQPGAPNFPQLSNGCTRLQVEIRDEHFENKVALRGFLSRKLSASLQVGTNRDEWIASPAIANAFYNPQLNSISKLAYHCFWHFLSSLLADFHHVIFVPLLFPLFFVFNNYPNFFLLCYFAESFLLQNKVLQKRKLQKE